MEDTKTKADMVLKVTGMQWKWQYEYPESGVKFISNMSTPRDQIANKEAKGDHHLLEVDNEVVAAGRQEGTHPSYRHRRDPYLVGTAVRGQARRRSRISARNLGQDRGAGVYRGQCAELYCKDTVSCRWSCARAGNPSTPPGSKEEGRTRRRRCRHRQDPERTN